MQLKVTFLTVFDNDRKNYQYDGTFIDNTLIARQKRFGKTTFVQNLGKNEMFDELKSITKYEK